MLFYLSKKAVEARYVAHIELERRGLLPQRLDFGHDGLRLGFFALVRQQDVMALLGQAQAVSLPMPRLPPVTRAILGGFMVQRNKMGS